MPSKGGRRPVHGLRRLERKAPKRGLAELRADFHRIVPRVPRSHHLPSRTGPGTAFTPRAVSEAIDLFK